MGGVMALKHRFGMSSSECRLSKAATDALVNLEEENSESVAKKEDAKAAAKKKKSAKDDANKQDSSGDADSTPKEGKDNKQNFFMAMRNSIVKAPNIGKKDHPQGSAT